MKLFTKSGVSVYGAGSSHTPNPGAVDIIFDLAGKYKQWGMPSHWKSAAIANDPVIVDMNIPDMTAPTWVTAKFWAALWIDLVEEAEVRGGKVDVLAICSGGHGRTGTVLAALALAAKAVPKAGLADPIEWVRSSYCEKAVETAAQINYICKTFNVKSGSTLLLSVGAYTAAAPSKQTEQGKSDAGGNGVVHTYGAGYLDDLYMGGLIRPKGLTSKDLM